MNVIESRVRTRSASIILDLGCGTGRFSGCRAIRFGARVVDIDPSEKMLQQALRKGAENGIQYERGIAEAMPLLDQGGGATGRGVVEPIDVFFFR